MRSYIERALALALSSAISLGIMSAIASLADADRAALLEAKQGRMDQKAAFVRAPARS